MSSTFEDTGKFAAALYDHVEKASAEYAATGGGPLSADNFLDVLAEKITKHGGGGGGGNGGVPPETHKKSIKRHNLVAVLLALVLGPGGAFAVLQAMDDRSKTNTHEVKSMKAEVEDDVKPRLDKVEESVDLIRVDVSKMGKSVQNFDKQQTAIVEGIDELKQENVKRLKDELDDMRRENRRLRRNR